jgi:hypothetical protein
MDLSPILARLRGQLTDMAVIGGAADLSAVEGGYVATPACYLVAMSESAEDNLLLGGFEQRLSISFSVFVVVSSLGDVAGETAMAALEPIRTQVKAALLGWVPEPTIGEPIRFAGASLLKLDAGLLWWADEFRFTTYLRNA